MTRTRKVIVAILLIFAIYAIVTSPEQSAAVVQSAIDWVLAALRSVGQFFDSLLTG